MTSPPEERKIGSNRRSTVDTYEDSLVSYKKNIQFSSAVAATEKEINMNDSDYADPPESMPESEAGADNMEEKIKMKAKLFCETRNSIFMRRRAEPKDLSSASSNEHSKRTSSSYAP